jgi:aminopeptidase-like protein
MYYSVTRPGGKDEDMASMLELIEELWHLEREIISDDFDRALSRLGREVPMKVHEYPTGTPVWTWKVPEKWTCHEAYLARLDGERLIDSHDHPLHVVSYSLPFEGRVSREELLGHLHTNPRMPETIPFVFKYYQRDWGLCATQSLYDSLTDEEYRVVIRTSFEPGTLKVGEIVIPGESEQCFVLAAHLCHPHMVNDDLTGVVVGVDVARELLSLNQRRYTYRFLILPETIGSVAYLSHNEDLIPSMVGGLFLEMLGNDAPLTLQQSLSPESQVDKCMVSALRGVNPESYVGPYRSIICNDERQFNSPGVRVPMLSLSRVENPSSPRSLYEPYPQYHSSADTPEIVHQKHLEEARDVVLSMLETFERDQYVVNNFKGEVFCSGYGIWIDYRVNPEGHRRLFEIMERCDGEHTITDIAAELGIPFQSVWEVVEILKEKELVWLNPTPHPTTPER